MSHKKTAEDELKKLKRELGSMRAFLGAGDSDHALVMLSTAERHLKKAADAVHKIEEAD